MLRTPRLDDERRELVEQVRRLLGALAGLLGRVCAAEEDQRALDRCAAELEGLFLLVVVGEFNSGKSALLNALLGRAVLDEGVTPTTSRVVLIAHGESAGREVLGPGMERVSLPLEALRDVAFVDTPGTNAVLREHEALTRDFVPRSDLVLFVTAADRPFAESERAFLETVRAWGKPVVVVVNRSDVLDGAGAVAEVVAFVRQRCAALLGFSPQVFPLSARLALKAKQAGDAERLELSGIAALERHLAQTLDEAERLRLKLLSPLGVATRLLARAAAGARSRLELLRADHDALEQVERQLEAYAEDLARDLRFRLADVERLLLEFEARGQAFFDETLRLRRFFDLLQRERVRAEFETRVVAGLPEETEARVTQTAEWMASAELRQWQAVLEALLRRQAVREEQMVGRVGPLERDRARLLQQVRAAAQRAVDGYDHAAEARRLAQAARDAVAGTALLQVGALGLGAAVAALATTTLADVTGLVAAGTLSVVGLLLLPARRQRARRELHRSVAALRSRLLDILGAALEAEAARSVQAMREAMGPYARFVRAERERWDGRRQEAGELETRLAGLRARIEALGRPG